MRLRVKHLSVHHPPAPPAGVRWVLPWLLTLAALFVHPVQAQGDRQGAVESLAGISMLTVDATVEGPSHLAESASLRTETLVREAAGYLRAAGVPVGAAGDRVPNLHIHLNMLQVESGLIAFSVELDLFQNVTIPEGRRNVRAATWNESVVGLVSHDMTSAIAESVEGLVEQFAEDFQTIN